MDGTVNVILDALKGKLVGRPSGNRQVIHCPFPENHRNGDRNPSATLNLVTGWVDCYVCGKHSPREVLRRIAGEYVNGTAIERHVEESGADYSWYEQLPPAAGSVIAKQRGLRPYTCNLYNLRVGDGKIIPSGALALPYVTDEGCIVGIKYRHSPPLPDGTRYGAVKGSRFNVPFGILGIDTEYRNPFLVIVEGEVNCLSVWQACGQFVDALSIGSQQPSPAMVDAIHRHAQHYRGILLWTDSGNHQEALAKALPRMKTVRVETTVRDGIKLDANEILTRYGAETLALEVGKRLQALSRHLNEGSVRLFLRGQEELLQTAVT